MKKFVEKTNVITVYVVGFLLLIGVGMLCTSTMFSNAQTKSQQKTVVPYRYAMEVYHGTGSGVLKPGTIVHTGGYKGTHSIIGTSTSPNVYVNIDR